MCDLPKELLHVIANMLPLKALGKIVALNLKLKENKPKKYTNFKV